MLGSCINQNIIRLYNFCPKTQIQLDWVNPKGFHGKTFSNVWTDADQTMVSKGKHPNLQWCSQPIEGTYSKTQFRRTLRRSHRPANHGAWWYTIRCIYMDPCYNLHTFTFAVYTCIIFTSMYHVDLSNFVMLLSETLWTPSLFPSKAFCESQQYHHWCQDLGLLGFGWS